MTFVSATMVLYRNDGIETALPRSASRSDSRMTSGASSHNQSGTPSFPGGRPSRSWKFVCVYPGQTAVTVTPRARYSALAQRENEMIHAFAAEYVDRGM